MRTVELSVTWAQVADRLLAQAARSGVPGLLSGGQWWQQLLGGVKRHLIGGYLVEKRTLFGRAIVAFQAVTLRALCGIVIPNANQRVAFTLVDSTEPVAIIGAQPYGPQGDRRRIVAEVLALVDTVLAEAERPTFTTPPEKAPVAVGGKDQR